mgnify:CR=1 FL=1
MFLMKEHVGKLISDVEELIYREKKPVESYRYKKAGAEKLAIDRYSLMGYAQKWGYLGRKPGIFLFSDRGCDSERMEEL